MLDISELARRSGVAASALRFYEEKGLIQSIGRRGLRRLFDDGVLEQLALIALGRASGLSLDEIGAMFMARRIDRKRLVAKAQELDGAIRRMMAMRDGLAHAANCPHSNQLECPKFRRLMRAALKGVIKPVERNVRRRSD